jgi:NADPH-dependent 2,4-dienoyl-CoA reductase/sulfur reductase-like enzyme
VREKVSEAAHRIPAKPRPTAGPPERIVIIGGGAAGYAVAEMLRRKGFAGRVTLVSADEPQRGFTSTFTKFWLVGARGKMSGPNSPPIGGLGEASWAFEVMLVVVPAVVVPSIVPDAVGDV